jgi:hypothetical protein
MPRVSPENKSLAYLYPQVLEYWDYSKNTVSPKAIGAQSSAKIWWKCLDKANHVWENIPSNIIRHPNNVRCPFCSLKRLHPDNTLAALYPNLAKEFDSEKNGLTPYDIIGNAGSAKYWWICSQQHEWNASLSNRVRKGSGCPACYGRIAHAGNSLQALFPEVAKELDVEKSGVTADQLVSGSEKRVWWKCKRRGHNWQTMVYVRTNLGSGCPYCSNQKINHENSLAALFPDIAAEFNAERNGFTADMVGAGALKWVWWKCAKGHEWESAISNRTSQNLGCPKCSAKFTSKIENRFRKAFKDSGIFDAIEEHPLKLRLEKDTRKYLEIDILATLGDAKIAIEYDGCYYHRNKVDQDRVKTEKLLALGYIVVRIREQTKYEPLAFLDVQSQNFIQVGHNYHALSKDISPTVNIILESIREVTRNNNLH